MIAEPRIDCDHVWVQSDMRRVEVCRNCPSVRTSRAYLSAFGSHPPVQVTPDFSLKGPKPHKIECTGKPCICSASFYDRLLTRIATLLDIEPEVIDTPITGDRKQTRA